MFNVLEIRIKVYQYITLKLAFAKIFQYHKIQGVLDLHLCLHEICVHGRSCNLNFHVKCNSNKNNTGPQDTRIFNFLY